MKTVFNIAQLTRLVTITSMLLVSSLLRSQFYINDTMLFKNSDYTQIMSGYETDSGYFLMSGLARYDNPWRAHVGLGFYGNDGQKKTLLNDSDFFHDQYVSGSNRLIKNDRGNFVIGYKNTDSTSSYPRIKEVSPEGTVLADVNFKALLDSLDLIVSVDYNGLIQLKYDSSYILSYVVDKKVNSTASSNLYIRLDKNFQLIRFRHLLSPTGFQSSAGQIVETKDGSFLSLNGIANLISNLLPNQIGRAQIRIFNKDLLVLRNFIYSDDRIMMVLTPVYTSKNELVFFCHNGIIDEDLEWEGYNHIVKLDSNFQKIWSYKMHEEPNYNFQPAHEQSRILESKDSSYVVCGGYFNRPSLRSAATITKLNQHGQVIWMRYLFMGETYAENTGTVIKDAVATADSGYCLFGYKNFREVIPNIYTGYILKTNCLGYLGEPSAAFSYSVVQGEITLINTSTQSRSYTWDFGDGYSKTAYAADYNSYQNHTDSIRHQYLFPGVYQIKLSAHGCNCAVDSISLEIPIDQDPIEEQKIGEGNFAIFPNPTSSNGQLYFYHKGFGNEADPLEIEIWDSKGRLIEKIQIPNTEGTYELRAPGSAGTYHLSVFQGQKIIDTRGFVVY